jgi:hypothetical protein
MHADGYSKHAVAGQIMSRRLNRTADVREYPPIYLEALAYHEAGHAVVAVLLEMPIKKIVIGPACTEKGFNGLVKLDLDQTTVLSWKCALMLCASEHSEKLSENYARFATLHEGHDGLTRFSIGVRSDLIQGFRAAGPIYDMMGLAPKTARAYFKREYRDLVRDILNVPVNQLAVHRLAACLQERLQLDGHEAKAIVLEQGPLRDGGLLNRWQLKG